MPDNDREARKAELLACLRRHEMNQALFEELAEWRTLVGDLGSYSCIVVPTTNDARLLPFMVGRVHRSLPIPTLPLDTPAGLRLFGKKYIFCAMTAADGQLTDESIYGALHCAMVVASTELVPAVVVPVSGELRPFIAAMESAVRAFEDLADTIGIHMPDVVFVADEV